MKQLTESEWKDLLDKASTKYVEITRKEGIAPRLKVLRACIRETAPKKRK